MSKSQEPPKRDPLASTVDKLLAGLAASSPAQAEPSVATPRPGRPGAPSERRPGPSRSRRPLDPMVRLRRAFWALMGQLTLAGSLAVALPLWPYSRGCGFPLFVYVVGVSMLLVTGAWSALSAWKIRFATAHVLALILVFWGIVLAAEQVLPRIGYAKAEATWFCSG